jgi:hypothetical protein
VGKEKANKREMRGKRRESKWKTSKSFIIEFINLKKKKKKGEKKDRY